jgi:hypothetical protein
MAVAGTYNVTVKSPMGEQAGTFTVEVSGDSFTGTLSGGLGTMEANNGKVSGDTLTWQMDMKVPMPMTLDCEATVTGDAIAGKVVAGPFGAMPLSGTRAG